MKLSSMRKSTSSKAVGKFVPGSKIPVDYLLDYLGDGYSIVDFISAYPWIKRGNVKKAITKIKKDIKKSDRNFQYVSV